MGQMHLITEVVLQGSSLVYILSEYQIIRYNRVQHYVNTIVECSIIAGLFSRHEYVSKHVQCTQIQVFV